MPELYADLGPNVVYVRHSELVAERPVVLFIHGLGDSHLAFADVLARPEFASWNLVLPDLPGYGRSSASPDYSFAAMRANLARLLDKLEQARNLGGEMVVVAHSLGVVAATMLCELAGERIKGLVAVEGSLTRYGAFVSEQASKAVRQNDFSRWFREDFTRDMVLGGLVREHPECAHYYASLQFARPEAFAENAVELRDMATALPGEWSHAGGELYAHLQTPRVYCYGETMASETVRFLREKKLDAKAFAANSHFVMQAAPDAFYPFAARWIGERFAR